jgi:hypothetical protein
MTCQAGQLVRCVYVQSAVRARIVVLENVVQKDRESGVTLGMMAEMANPGKLPSLPPREVNGRDSCEKAIFIGNEQTNHAFVDSIFYNGSIDFTLV